MVLNMKRISVSSFLRVTASIAVVVLLVVFFVAMGNSQSVTTTGDIVTPLVFTPTTQTDEWAKASSNASYELWVNAAKAQIRLHDTERGTDWVSTPDGLEDMEGIKGAAKMSLGALLSFKYADRDSNISVQNSLVGSTNKKTMAVKAIPNGIRFDFMFETEGFIIPLEITLTKHGLQASIPLSDIQERNSSVKLISITPLPNFAAGKLGTDGYLLLPDESGMLMSFKRGYADYSARVYGDDLSIVKKTRSQVTGTALLPVFGVRHGSQGMVAIVTEGDARVKVNASSATQRSPFTTVQAEFVYRESILVDVSQKTFESTQVNMFETPATQIERFSVEYRPLNDPTYVGMASAYRSYLMEDKGMKPLDNVSSSLYIRLIGGVKEPDQVLGIPVNRVTPITSFQQAETILSQLKEEGIDFVKANYLYWNSDGDQAPLFTKLKAESRLGGSKQLQSLLNKAESLGAQIILDVNVLDMVKSQDGYSVKSDASQTIQNEPAIQYFYKMSTFQKDTSSINRYLLSPRYLFELVSKGVPRLKGFNTIYSANSLGEKLYSDFGKKAMDRGLALREWEKSLALLSDNGVTSYSHANAYVFPYAKSITEAPVSTSGYLAEDNRVPFYTIALHGLVDLSMTSINAQNNTQTALLKSLETGVQLSYTFGYDNFDALKNSLHNQYAYSDFKAWKDIAAAQYREVAAYYEKIGNQAVKTHEILSEQVVKTVFENGVGVIVNYSDAPVEADGHTIEAKSYVKIGW